MVAQQGDEPMRTMLLIMVAMCAGCAGGDEDAAVQAVAGPGGVTVTPRAAGQLAVSWSADPAAVKYYVFQGAGGGLPSFAASVLDSGGGPPSTSYIATGLSDGVRYCYAIESAYADGTMSDMGAAGCGTATGGGVPPVAVHTRVIAPNPTGIPAYSVIDIVNLGTGNATTNLDEYFTVGDHLRAIRLYVQDSTQPGPCVGCSGPTRLVSRLKAYSPSTGSVPTTLATSNISDGTGIVQVLAMTQLDVAIVGGGVTHSLQTIDNIGVAPTIVWSIEVDYTAAP